MKRLDMATVVGLGLAGACLLFAILLTPGASWWAFVDLPSMVLVLGGSLAAATMSFPFRTLRNSPRVLRKVFWNECINLERLVQQLVEFSNVARRQGLLALDRRLPEIENHFLRLGLQMAVDGTRAEVVADILRAEIAAVETRHREGKGFIDQLARQAPSFGMIGTLLGLIFMLGNLRDPSSIGAGMAVALITTLYGVLVANVLLAPMSEKLAFLHAQEMLAMHVALRGIQAIQAGENPRAVEQSLRVYLPHEDSSNLRAA